MTRLAYLLALLLMFMFGISCSGSGQSPVSPDMSSETTGITGNSDTAPVFVSDSLATGEAVAGMGILGVFQGHIDLENATAELISTRSSALVDTLEVVDITNFMTMAPCVDCAKIASVEMNEEGYPVLTIGIRHPFDEGDPFKPITGRNRGDLHVFNVEGIVAMQSTEDIAFAGLGQVVAKDRLINADGYTTYLNPYLDMIMPTTATAHPYKLHFADYSEGNFDPLSPTGFESITIPHPSGNLVMPMGSDFDYQDYIFDIESDSSITFLYAVGCTYAVSSATRSERFNPEYRVPQHNKKAASEVHVEITRNDLRDGDASSDAEITIKVLDMNHGVPVGTALNEMEYESNVADIIIEIPGLLVGTHNDYAFIEGDPRDPENPLTYTSQITNQAGAPMGVYTGLVKVLDSYPVGQNQSPLLDGKDGIQRVDPLENPLTGVFDIPEFATYAAFRIEVELRDPQDPIAIIDTIPDPPDLGTTAPWLILDGSRSYDPDGGDIILYEWMFEWDGDPANFNPDVVGTEAIVEYNYRCIEGEYKAALRVTDDNTPPGVSQIASVDITVTDDYEPGEWEGSVHLGSGRLQGDQIYMTTQALNVDSTGLVHIIYRTTSSIMHRTFDGVSVSGAYAIPGVVSPRMVTSALDGDDELHVVWIHNASDGQHIRHAVSSGGSFAGSSIDTLFISEPEYRSQMMNIHKNKDDILMITWIHYDEPKIDAYYYYTINDGSGFTTPERIPYQIHMRTSDSERPGYVNQAPNLVSTPDGHFHHFFYSKIADLHPTVVIYQYEYDGTQWLEPRIAHQPPDNRCPFDIHVAVSRNGDIHITGLLSNPRRIRYIRYEAAIDTWHPALTASHEEHRYYAYGDMTVDDAGYVHLVYPLYEYEVHHMKVFCSWCDESYIQSLPALLIDETTINQEHAHADLTWDHDGRLLAIYQDSRNSPNVYFNVLTY